MEEDPRRGDKRKEREEVDDEENQDMDLDESSLTRVQLYLVDACCLRFATDPIGVQLLAGTDLSEDRLSALLKDKTLPNLLSNVRQITGKFEIRDLAKLNGEGGLGKTGLKEIQKRYKHAASAVRATERAAGGRLLPPEEAFGSSRTRTIHHTDSLTAGERTSHSTDLATGSREASPERMDVEPDPAPSAERRPDEVTGPVKKAKEIEALPDYARNNEECEEVTLEHMQERRQTIQEITKVVKDAFNILPGKLNMRTSTMAEINKAFQKPLVRVHPDRFLDATPEEKKKKQEEFQRLNAAKTIYKIHKKQYGGARAART